MQVQAIPSRLFTFRKDDNGQYSAVTELSDLNGFVFNQHFSKGFKMQSSKTALVIDCVFVKSDRDADNDLTFWEFNATLPDKSILKVTILND